MLFGFRHQPLMLREDCTPRVHTLRLLAVVAGHKAAATILLLLCPVLFPAMFTPLARANLFQTWDTGAYLDIAARGYRSREACAFYPLWPACIKVGSWLLGGRAAVASYVLANLFSLGGLLLFHRLVWEREGPSTADVSALLLLLYPGAAFFCVPYSESLFFLLLMACLLCVRRRACVGAAVAAALLPLTRATGIFVLPLIVWELFRNRAPLRQYVICVAPLAGYAAYFGIMRWCTGSAMAGFQAQRLYPAQPSIANILDVTGFLHCFIGFGWMHDYLHSFIDRFVFVAFLLTLFWIARLDIGYYVYAMLAGLLPALSNSLMSFTRFSTLVFPLFIVWGMAMKRGWCMPFVLLLFFGVQVMFLLLHVSGVWAG